MLVYRQNVYAVEFINFFIQYDKKIIQLNWDNRNSILLSVVIRGKLPKYFALQQSSLLELLVTTGISKERVIKYSTKQ